MAAEKDESAQYLYGAVTNPFFSGDAEETDEQLPVDPRFGDLLPCLCFFFLTALPTSVHHKHTRNRASDKYLF